MGCYLGRVESQIWSCLLTAAAAATDSMNLFHLYLLSGFVFAVLFYLLSFSYVV